MENCRCNKEETIESIKDDVKEIKEMTRSLLDKVTQNTIDVAVVKSHSKIVGGLSGFVVSTISAFLTYLSIKK